MRRLLLDYDMEMNAGKTATVISSRSSCMHTTRDATKFEAPRYS